MTWTNSVVFIGLCICVGHVHGKDAFQWKASAFLDWDSFGPIYQKNETEDVSEWQLRRAKLGMDYRLSKQWKAELDIKLTEQSLSQSDSESEIEIADANVQWRTAEKELEVTLGKMKQPFSHERLMSSDQLPGIERSMATSVFSEGRSLGVQFGYKSDSQTISSGIFESKVEEDQLNAPDVWTWVNRWTGTLNLSDGLVHLGAGYAFRDLNDSLFQLEEKGEVNSADKTIRGARFYADSQQSINVEAGLQWSKFWLMGEFFQSQVKASDGDHYTYEGFYVQWIYGSRARYKYKDGRFKAKNKLSNEWEMVVRYSGLSLRDNGVGAEAGSLLVGANYYLTPNVAFMINHLRPSISGNVVNTDLTGNATSARVKFRF